ncbi:MAG: radical SAM family heme chaperone HemW [Clostridia bacterium]
MSGIYIHIPYCRERCDYCAFVSGCNLSTQKDYVNALKKEMSMVSIKDNIDTLFIGGGTPTCLFDGGLTQIFECLAQNFNLNLREFTVEGNPESVLQKAQEFKNIGVTRVSVGVQSLNDKTLKAINRLHTAKEAICAVQKLVKNFDVNVDLMLGLPYQSKADIVDFIDTFAGLGVEHFSCYSLQLEAGTKLYKKTQQNLITLPSEDETCDMYDLARKTLQKYNINRYEISNFAKEGKECLHNLGYWQCSDYYGFGVASHSLVKDIRYYNNEDITKYICAINADKLPQITEEILTPTDKMNEAIMLALRLEKGLDILKFNKQFNTNFIDKYAKAIDKNKNYIQIENNFISICENYFNVSNTIICDFIC